MQIIKIKMENIKSKFIVKRIFENLKTRKKLNIVKHSKKYLDILNIDKKDFASIVSLKNLDNKFHLDLDIADTNIKVLDLSKAKLITGEIKDYFRFKNINNLVNVTIIEAITLDKLEVLDLGDNYIRELNISKIDFLNKNIFPKLEILNLKKNKINLIENKNENAPAISYLKISLKKFSYKHKHNRK